MFKEENSHLKLSFRFVRHLKAVQKNRLIDHLIIILIFSIRANQLFQHHRHILKHLNSSYKPFKCALTVAPASACQTVSSR